MSGGPFYWGSPIARLPLNLNLYESALGPQMVFSQPAAGVQIPILGGGAVHQISPPSIHAPLTLTPQTLSLEFIAVEQEDYFQVRRLTSMAHRTALWMVIEDPLEEMWVVPSTDKRLWTFARSTALHVVGAVDHLVRVVVLDAGDSGSETVLSAGGASPGVGEYYLDLTSEQTELKTNDLSASAGDWLICRAYFWTQWTVLSVTRSIQTPNGLVFSAELAEFIERRDWSEV